MNTISAVLLCGKNIDFSLKSLHKERKYTICIKKTNKTVTIVENVEKS